MVAIMVIVIVPVIVPVVVSIIFPECHHSVDIPSHLSSHFCPGGLQVTMGTFEAKVGLSWVGFHILASGIQKKQCRRNHDSGHEKSLHKDVF
jgi:hypothetical protein